MFILSLVAVSRRETAPQLSGKARLEKQRTDSQQIGTSRPTVGQALRGLFPTVLHLRIPFTYAARRDGVIQVVPYGSKH